eukprot:3850755-Rhodomonas_salina.1
MLAAEADRGDERSGLEVVELGAPRAARAVGVATERMRSVRARATPPPIPPAEQQSRLPGRA